MSQLVRSSSVEQSGDLFEHLPAVQQQAVGSGLSRLLDHRRLVEVPTAFDLAFFDGEDVLSGTDDLPIDDGFAGVGADSAATISSIGTDNYEVSGADAPAYEVSFDTFRHVDLPAEAD